MTQLLWTTLVVVACAIAAWFIMERFSPDGLLTKLIQIAIFLFVAWWVVFKLIPQVM